MLKLFKLESWGAPVLYALLAFLTSLFLLQFNSFINPDGAEYVRFGENIFSGAGLAINSTQAYVSHPPFYPFLIGLLTQITGNGEFSGHLISCLSFSLSLLPLFAIVEMSYSRRAAHWFALLFLTHGFLLVYANIIIAEPLLLFLTSLMLLTTQRLIQEGCERRYFNVCFLGVCGGLAYLTHPLGALFFGGALLSIVLLVPHTVIGRVSLAAFALGVFLIFAVPYALFVREITDQLQLSGVAVRAVLRRYLDMARALPYSELKKIYEGLSADKTELKLDEMARQFSLWEYVVKDQFAMLRFAFPTLFVRFAGLSSYMYAGVGFVLTGAALLGNPWSPRRTKIEAVRFLFLLPFLAFAFTVFEQRYYFPFIPILLLWAAQGLEVLCEWLQKSFRWTAVRAAAATVVFCVLMALPSVFYVARSIQLTQPPREHYDLGLWMKAHIPDIRSETIAAQVPYAAFYSGAGILRLPYVENFSDLLVYLRHHKARYFVVGDDLDTPTLNSYRFLLTDGVNPAMPPSIRLRHAVKERKNIFLYEVME